MIVYTALATAAGCAGSDQVITGQVQHRSFPEPITHVRAVGTATMIEAPVAADGSFTIAVPSDDRYRIELTSNVRRSELVFPRKTGAIDATFFVAAAREPIALGAVRYTRDPANQTYVFDVQCDNAAEGSVCVQDDGSGGGGGGGDTGTGGGQDTGTGGGQDTGTGGGQDTGRHGDEGGSCGGDVGEPGGAAEASVDGATADRNPPEAIGCSDTDGDSGGGGQDSGGGGQDTGTSNGG